MTRGETSYITEPPTFQVCIAQDDFHLQHTGVLVEGSGTRHD